uniref:Uncharacterized protein n=1 Tax=Ditylum brightwellii TaxID=49249 RepID=A0A6V2BML0_9STRA
MADEDYGITTTSKKTPLSLTPPTAELKCCPCTCAVPTCNELLERDTRLLRASLLLILLLNIPYGRYILYPFLIFSTWVHEMCHGIAAIMIGGQVEWLNVYPDGSGLAYTMIPDLVYNRAFVAGAGYQGTAVAGGIMLMFRRTVRGPRIGCGLIGIVMLLSCFLWVRNIFGLGALIPMGVALVLSGVCLPKFWIGELYALVAATCCLNAITSIQVLFGTTESSIGGVVRASDATTMEELFLVPYWIWATIWLCLALVMTIIGIVVVVDGGGDNDDSEGSSEKKNVKASEQQELVEFDSVGFSEFDMPPWILNP